MEWIVKQYSIWQVTCHLKYFGQCIENKQRFLVSYCQIVILYYAYEYEHLWSSFCNDGAMMPIWPLEQMYVCMFVNMIREFGVWCVEYPDLVVQSIGSLTKSLLEDLLSPTVLTKSTAAVFSAEKSMELLQYFCTAKVPHIVLAKHGSILHITYLSGNKTGFSNLI